jgi:hypothetical protein
MSGFSRSVERPLPAAEAGRHGRVLPRLLMNIAGIGGARRVIDKSGRPAPLAVDNGHLNGEVIRLDGALRMAPR